MPRYPSEPEPAPPSLTRRLLIGAAAGASAGLVAVLTGFSGVLSATRDEAGTLSAPVTNTGGRTVPPSRRASPTPAATSKAPPPTSAAPPPPPPKPPPARHTEPPKPPPPTPPAGQLVAKVGDVPVGGGTVLTSEAVVVTQPASGQFDAFSATCTHNGCIVAGVQDGDIVCGCHGSRFSITDGSVRQGPARSPLSRRTVNIDGGNIYLV